MVDTLGSVTVARQRVGDDLSKAFAALRRHPPPLAADSFLSRPPDQTLVLTLRTQGLPYITDRLMQLDSIYFAPVEWAGRCR